MLKLNLSATVPLMARSVFEGQKLTGSLKMGFKANCLLSGQAPLCTGNCFPSVLISAQLNIWISRLRWQQTIYFCLLHWCLSQCCTGCLPFNICGSGVVTCWLNSQKAVVFTRKSESKMALKWSHSGLGYGGNDDRIHSSLKFWSTEQLKAFLSLFFQRVCAL